MEKVAVIQLDAMNLRLLLVEVEGIYFRVHDEIVETLKLGKDIKEIGMINIANVSSSLKILKMFRKVCDINNVTRSYSIATEIFKFAKNEKSFFEEIYNNTGFNFQILSPEEVVKTIYSGVINSLAIPKGFLFHIDYNSTIIISFNRRNILKYAVVPYGALNLAEKYENSTLPNSQKYAEMISFMENEIKASFGDFEIEPDTNFLGSGTSFLNLGKLARKATKYPLNLENNYVVTRELTNQTFKFVEGLDLDKTMKIKGITQDRADSLATGLCIIEALANVFKFEELTISSDGFREGAIYNYVVPQVLDKPLSEMLNYSLESIRTFYDKDRSGGNQLYQVTLILFKQIKVLHKLSRFYVKPLKIAASLYDCGKRVNFENNIEASFNVILNSKISGATHKEILISAFSSLCQDPDALSLSEWVKYKDLLTEEDLDAVRKIGMIIKLATALDKSKNNVVEDISCDILGDSVILKTIVNGDASFEILLANKIAPEFKKVFKKNLQVI